MNAGAPTPCLLYLGTEDGLRVARLTSDGLEILAVALAGNAVRAIAIDRSDPADAYVGCGLRGRGLYRTRDAGETVESVGFEDRWVWGVARHPTDSDTTYVGTEPPMLYVSGDDGATFEAFEAIDELPSRPTWTFFHEPFRAGHVHGIAIHPDRPDRIFAGVEHGALIYTTDGGATWNEALVGHDVHRVAVDPAEPTRVFAATGAGLYRSRDAGTSWESITPLEGAYLHSIVFDPSSDRIYVYADRDGKPLYASEDGGNSWEFLGDELPASRPADNLRLHPDEPKTLVYAGDTGEETSHLFISTDAGATWQRLDEPLPKVWRLEVARDPS